MSVMVEIRSSSFSAVYSMLVFQRKKDRRTYGLLVDSSYSTELTTVAGKEK